MRQPDHVRTVLKDWTVLETATLGLATLGLAGWYLFVGQSPDELHRTVSTHLHCSACQHEIPYCPSKVGKRCAMCTAGVYTPPAASSRSGGKSGWARFVAFVLLAAASFYIRRRMAYRLKGELGRAVADCTAALQLAPDKSVAYRDRAGVYGDKAAMDEAIADFPTDDSTQSAQPAGLPRQVRQ